MTPRDFKHAEELLSNPDAEDCERFASWYGRTLLDAARNQADLVSALKIAQHALITSNNYRVTDLSVEAFDAHLANGVPRDRLEFVTDFSADLAVIDAAIAKASTPTSGEAQ